MKSCSLIRKRLSCTTSRTFFVRTLLKNATAYYQKLIETRSAETIANMAIVLLYQEDYLLHRQLESL